MGKFKYPRELVERAKAGSREATAEILEKARFFIIKRATDLCKNNPALEMDDLIQRGNLAVMRSIHRYDLDRGQAGFQTYAFCAVINDTGREAKNSSRLGECEVGMDKGDLDEFVEKATTNDAYRHIAEKILELDQIQRDIMILRISPFLKGGQYAPWTYISKMVGRSVEECEIIYNLAVETVRAKLDSD
jgi:DNA-directed RNA polymerase specialized sigma subunit